jgi:hypothetical protein
MTHTDRPRLYRIWANMKNRCRNPKNTNFHYYGGRGIDYDPRWESFEGFLDTMPSGYHSLLCIDRIDNNKGYSLENCRWVTYAENNANQRPRQPNRPRPSSFKPELGMSFLEASRLHNLHVRTLRDRFLRGDRPPHLYRPLDSDNTAPVRLYDEGQSLVEIARSMGAEIQAVYGRYRKGERGAFLRRPLNSRNVGEASIGAQAIAADLDYGTVMYRKKAGWPKENWFLPIVVRIPLEKTKKKVIGPVYGPPKPKYMPKSQPTPRVLDADSEAQLRKLYPATFTSDTIPV